MPTKLYNISRVCKLVEEVETCSIMSPQSENNDAEDDEGRRAREAQSDPEYEPADQEDDGSSEEDDDSQDLDFTLQTPRKTENTLMCAARTDRISNSSKPKNGATMHPHKTSKTRSDNKKGPPAGPVSCPICHRQFKGPFAKGSLRQHLDLHAPEPKYPCPHCPARFKQGPPRHRHIQRVHPKVKPTYGKSSSQPKNGSSTNPNKLSKTHGDDTKESSALSTHPHPFSCPICHKQFKGRGAKSNLKHHLEIHAPEPKYPCPRCPAKFKQEKSRQRHIKQIHLKIKPHACDVCDFKSSRVRDYIFC
jgi:uncharacterized C2H2 Zn-finger protein